MTAVIKVLVIARANLLGNVLDRKGAVLMLLLPLALTSVLGVIHQSVANVTVGVVALGTGPVTDEVIDELEGTENVVVVRFMSYDLLLEGVRRQQVQAGVVLPSEIEGGAPTEATVKFVHDENRPYPLAARGLVGGAVTEAGNGDEIDPAARAGVDLEGGGSSTTLGFDYVMPANLVLFMFVNSLGFASGMVSTRRNGCERRMLATPTAPWTLLAGDFLGRFSLAVLQGLIIVTIGTAVFGVDWGSPLLLMSVVALFAATSVGAAQILGTISSKKEQVLAVGVPLGLMLGMLGGSMWPLRIVSDTMREIGHLTPHAWAIDALLEVKSGASVREVRGEMAGLVAFAVSFFTIATALMSRRLRRGDAPSSPRRRVRAERGADKPQQDRLPLRFRIVVWVTHRRHARISRAFMNTRRWYRPFLRHKWLWNLWPPLLGAGVRVQELDADAGRAVVRLGARLRNRTFAGSHFGGALFTMCDPFVVFLLTDRIPQVTVWDKSVRISFIRPTRRTVQAEVRVDDHAQAVIRSELAARGRSIHTFRHEIRDEVGLVAVIEKDVVVRALSRDRPKVVPGRAGSLSTLGVQPKHAPALPQNIGAET